MTDAKQLLRDLITANHIIHYHGVVDAYGHISVRHPDQPDTYLMSANMAPALVSSPTDFVQYRVEDSTPYYNENAPRGFIERYIHSEIYKRYPHVQCVVHSHAEAVLPYAVSGVPLEPMYHMAGFLGAKVPVYDIEESYQPGDVQDLLVRTIRLGSDLAGKFSSEESLKNPSGLPDHNVVLMRRHGFTTYGRTIKEAVSRAIYTNINAKLQTSSSVLRSAVESSSSSSGSVGAFAHPFESLTPQQAKDSAASGSGTTDRPWQLWEKEVESQNLYTNNG
ncbi:hypothetical protein MMC08_008526 [Hypocenomyce scalaris]|nr:hypothetical protein [Hypocenomyce scalaris]